MCKFVFSRLLLVVSLLLFFAPRTNSQGWESEYEGVMLQGFYWDSFEDTKWTNLTSQVDELSAYFDLIWVPNSASSGYTSMGYMPQYWFQHESSFGTASELRSMINAYKKKGTGFIADVVINHRNGVNGWCDFPTETDHKGNTWSLGLWAICGNDEMAYTDGQPTPTGAYDEGENFDGCRDLDHTNSYVQDAVKAYLDYLLNDLGYTGFRYDMSKGYAAYYTGLYNEAAKPKYSVGEYYDGNYSLVSGWIDGTIRNNAIQSAAFDFPLKFRMNEAFAYPSDFTKLATYYNGSNQPEGLLKEPGFRRFSVTFVDNHDTYRDGSKFSNDSYVMAANAFIMCNPGTPCVFLSHWKSYKDEIKRLIDIRKSVGVHNQSTVEVWEVTQGHYAAKVYGKNGDLFVKVGYDDYSPYGYDDNDIVASGEGYCVWTKTKIVSGEDKIVPDNDKNGFSVYVKKSSVPQSWSSVYCYAWTGEKTRLTSVFPGELMTKIVTIAGEKYYKYSFDSSTTSANIVLSNGDGSQTVDVTGITKDTYFTISSSVNSASKYTVNKISSVSGSETGELISVYLLKSSIPDSWNAVKYYAWDKSGNTLLNSWPGTSITQVEMVNGEAYYKHTFSSSVTMANVIFTDGSSQTHDIKGVDRTGFYKITDASEGKYQVEQLNVSDAGGISVYLQRDGNTESWSNVYYYAWDNNDNPIIGTWPGKKIAETIIGDDGCEYYCYTFDSSLSAVNIIFNDGSGNQTVDIKGVVETSYYRLNGKSGKTITVTKLEQDEQTALERVALDEDSPIEYYTLQGVKVVNPHKGVYIKKRGSVVTKVIF